MGKQVDDRVVTMEFDNAQFERNVNQSISTLDKLKNALHLDKSADALNQVGESAKRIDLNPLNSGLETASSKFREVAKVAAEFTVVSKVVDGVINKATQLNKAFVIEPVTTGLNEYEMKMTSVQTIMSSTGESVETVSKYLNELNKYSDETIYSFKDMTDNIGKFTNAGVKLDDAVLAIKGIANEAALSGANANEASRAMYNFSQALSSGYVKLIDWKSIENANMATKSFKDELLATAETMGTVTKSSDGMYKAGKKTFNSIREFNDSLQEGWMTSDVLIKTLQKYTDKQTKVGQDAYEAATKVKTFHQMIDVLKETAQSGWAQTWETIIGNIEEAKGIFTPMTDFFANIIGSVDNFRNKILESVMNNPVAEIVKKVNNIKESSEEAKEVVEDLGDIVSRVINGEFGNGEDRMKKLADAGYDFAKVQNGVNEALGDSYRYDVKINEAIKQQTKSTDKLTDAKLKELGLTGEEILQYRKLEYEAKQAGMTIQQYLAGQDTRSGRELIIESFSRIGKVISLTGVMAREAWKEIFPDTGDNIAKSIYNVIVSFNHLTENLNKTSTIGNELYRTFKGIFAAIDIIRMILSGPTKLAIQTVLKLMGYADVDILKITANMGDFIVHLRDMMKEFDPIGKGAAKMADAISKLVKKFGELKCVKDAVEFLKGIDLYEDGKYIIEGLRNGIGDGIKDIIKTMTEVANTLITTFTSIVRIASPSKLFYEFGQFIIAGLRNGMGDNLDKIKNFITNLTDVLKGEFEDINWNNIFAIGISVGLVKLLKDFIKIIDKATNPLDAISGAFTKFGNIFGAVGAEMPKTMENINFCIKQFGKNIKAQKFKTYTEGIKELALALLMMVGAVVIVAKLNVGGQLNDAMLVIAGLSAVLMGLAYYSSNMSASVTTINKEGLSIKKNLGGFVGIAASLLIIVGAMKLMSTMTEPEIHRGMEMMIALMTALGIFVWSCKSVESKSDDMKGVGTMLLKMGITMLAMTKVIKMLGELAESDPKQLIGGILGLVGVVGILAGLMAATRLLGKDRDIAGFGTSMLMLAASMGVMGFVVKSMGKFLSENPTQAKKGLVLLAGLAGGIVVFMIAIKAVCATGTDASKVGIAIMGVALAIAIMAKTAKVLSKMNPKDILKGGIAITYFGLICTGLMGLMSIIGGTNGGTIKLAASLVAMSVAIGVLSGCCAILSMLDPAGLARAVVAIDFLALAMSGMMFASSFVNGSGYKSIIAMSIALGVMSASMAALSIVGSKDGKALMTAAGSMVAVMTSFAVMCGIAGKMQGGLKNLLMVGAMTAIVAALAGIIYALSKVKPENAIAASGSISLLLISLTASLALLQFAASPMALVSAAIMTAIVGGLAAIIYALGKMNPLAALTISEALSNMLLKLSVATLILAAVGATGPAAIVGALNLIGVLGVVGLFLAEVGAVMTYIPKLQEFIQNGVPVLEDIAYALGHIFGNIIGGFTAGALSGLPEIGNTLSLFMENMTPFINQMEKIDPSFCEGIKMLGEAFLALEAANIIDMVAKFAGGDGFEGFAAKLVPFGEAICDFAKTVTGDNAIDVKAVKSAANAGKLMAEMAKALPNSGGVLGFLAGENDMDEFGQKMCGFGRCVVSFSNTIMSNGGIDSASIKSAANAGKLMSEMAANLPNTGGGLGLLLGNNDMDEFGIQLAGFGRSIVTFSNTLKNNGGVDNEAVKNASNAGTMLAAMNDNLKNVGGVISWFTGDNKLDEFGSQLLMFGTALVGFSQTSANIDPASIDAGIQSSMSLTNLSNSLDNGSGDKLVKFGKKLEDFGDYLKKYLKTIKGISAESVSGAESAINSLTSLVNKFSALDGTNIGGMDKFVKDLSKTSTDTLKMSFSDNSGDIIKAGKDFAGNVAKGITQGIPSVKNSVYSVTKAVSPIHSEFVQAGRYFGEGLVNGMKQMEQSVYDAGYKLGKKAVQGEMDGQKSHSPSRAMIQAGHYLGQGLVIGMRDSHSMVSQAGYRMGENAVDTIKDTLNAAGRTLKMDGNLSPTIRPVLDLTEVNNGVSRIGELMGNKSFDLSGRLNAISGKMSTYGSDLSNRDLVNAINRLDKHVVESKQGSNYTINGITYDDGTNVSSAVKSLIHAAQIERRI